MADVIRPPEGGVEALEQQEFYPAGAEAAAIGGLAVGTPPAAQPELDGGEARSVGSPLRLTVATFIENKVALLGVGLFVLLVLFSFVGPAHLRNQPAHRQPGLLQPPAQLRPPAWHRRRRI